MIDLAVMLPAEASRTFEKLHPGVWAQRRLGMVNERHHWEWYEFQMLHSRCAVCAPRESSKSAVFSVISTAHKAVFTRGSWQYLFSASLDQSKLLLERVVSTIAAVEPWLLEGAPRFSSTDVILANWSRIQIASIGKSMRGIHPDRIVGDDVLDDDTSMTDYQRRKMTGWWFGSVGPMAHPGTMRPMQWGLLKPKGSSDIPMLRHPPTTITLAGTPFHQLDLLMSMRDNPVYAFRRYAAEFDPKELIPGTMALEATDIMRAA